MGNIRNYLDNSILYWQKCLANSEHIDVRNEEISAKFDTSDDLNILPSHITQKLFKAYKKSVANSNQDTKFKKGQDDINFIPILFAPIIGQSITRDKKNKILIPLWLEGSLDKKGKINLTPDAIPIINTDCVEPNVREGFSFGVTRKEIDEAISKVGGIPKNCSIDNLQSYFDKLFLNELDCDLNNIEYSEPYQLTNDRYIRLDNDERGVNQSLIETYSEINEKDEKPILHRTVFSDQKGQLISRININEEKHTGHISGQYPLNDGQRETLHAHMHTGKGDILAVTGPPGTGKTTLIGNIVASEWVNAAIDEKESPVIFICSTNNQAVQNAINSFSEIENLPENHTLQNKPALLKRWVKDVSSFGSLFPSSTSYKKEETKSFQTITRERGKIKWSGWITELEDLNDLQDRKDFYIESAHKAFPDNQFKTIDETVGFIHTQLLSFQKQLNGILHVQGALVDFQSQYEKDNIEKFLIEKIDTYTDEKNDLELRLQNINDTLQHYESQDNQFRSIGNNAITLLRPKNIIEKIGSFFSQNIRQQRSLRTINFLSDNKLAHPEWGFDSVINETDLRKYLTLKGKGLKTKLKAEKDKRQNIQTQLEEATHNLEHWIEEQETYKKLVDDWSKILKETPPFIHDANEVLSFTKNPHLFNQYIDRHCRLLMFFLASRYWEGRWILDLENLENEGKENLYGSLQGDIEGFFKRLSKLTPCLGSTIHMMPKLFQFYAPKQDNNNPSLFDFIDLLIMDEAGQVSTEIGMTSLAFAEKALIIGDTDQIEPIRSFGNNEDIKLMKEFDLIDVYDDMEERGLSASSGNMMQMAKMQSAISIDENTKGMFLSDHWRCVPKIINYCNELVYKGRLILKKPSKDNPVFPAMGFAHIPSQSVKKGGSRFSPIEADVIVDWIVNNAANIKKAYDGNLADILGIVTPFSAQATEISKSLKQAGIKDKIQVGTVHRFQGGEKNLMIFSPVYGMHDDVKSYFFDSGKNMMNVAVSRAKDSFLVFGDMRIFANQPNSTPSGLLGHHLLSDLNNEITDINVPTRIPNAIEMQCERIRTLEDHRNALHEALTQSKERIIIMSAFLSYNAIEQDNIISLLKEAGERGVKRLVLYDIAFNKNKKRAEKVIKAFEKADVPIHGVNGIHHKTLAYDNQFYMDGSFNWLSAQRNSSHKFHNGEGSLLVRGNEAQQWIDETWQEACQLVKEAKRKS